MNTAAIPGRTSGRKILYQICRRVQPSIMAERSTSQGIPSKKPLAIQIPKGISREARARATPGILWSSFM